MDVFNGRLRNLVFFDYLMIFDYIILIFVKTAQKKLKFMPGCAEIVFCKDSNFGAAMNEILLRTNGDVQEDIQQIKNLINNVENMALNIDIFDELIKQSFPKSV